MIAAPPIDQIVRTIVDSVHPRRVVLFGSHARGDARADSDVDLMVEIDGEADKRGREAQICRLFLGAPWEVDPKVYATEWVTRLRDDPGVLIYTIVREGKVLYTRPDVGSAPSVVRETPPEPESVAWWVRAAEEDLLVIEQLTLASRVPWGAVCFHAQQAAEKYLKVLLVMRGQRPERTHNLPAILAACRSAGYDLADVDADCESLSRFAIAPRYPDDSALFPAPHTHLEGRAAADACLRIVSAAKQHLT